MSSMFVYSKFVFFSSDGRLIFIDKVYLQQFFGRKRHNFFKTISGNLCLKHQESLEIMFPETSLAFLGSVHRGLQKFYSTELIHNQTPSVVLILHLSELKQQGSQAASRVSSPVPCAPCYKHTEISFSFLVSLQLRRQTPTPHLVSSSQRRPQTGYQFMV